MLSWARGGLRSQCYSTLFVGKRHFCLCVLAIYNGPSHERREPSYLRGRGGDTAWQAIGGKNRSPLLACRVQLLHGGQGAPLLVLHGAGGILDGSSFTEALAQHFHVYAPSHPGFGASERPDWMERVHDLAYFYRWFIDALQLAPLPIVGFSMGGWLAAEMVAMYPASISRMVLVGAAGIKPSVGEITDIFLITPEEVLQQFYDPTQARVRAAVRP